MRIFLAGASGVVGRRMIPRLLADGHIVTGITRTADNAQLIQSLGARPVIVNVFDREALFTALREARPDAVIHQLTDLSGWDLEANARLRIEGTRNLVDAARAVDVRRMVAQSLAFVYAPGNGPAREDDPLYLDAPSPLRRTVEGVFALEQAVGEMEVGVVLRYGRLYGPGTWNAPGGIVAERVRRGELNATAAVVSFLHVEDAALSAVLALDWPAGPVNIVDDEPAPETEWLPIYAAAIGAPPPETADSALSAVSPSDRGASNAKARRAYGWQPLYPTWRIGFFDALG